MYPEVGTFNLYKIFFYSLSGSFVCMGIAGAIVIKSQVLLTKFSTVVVCLAKDAMEMWRDPIK